MKMVKNLAVAACALSFMFANVTFYTGNYYDNLDTSPVAAETAFGASWALNETTSLGYDGVLGMLMSFNVGATTLRMGWGAETSLGLGFTWWSGGDGLNTSISTNYDMVGTTDPNGTVSMVVGFGF
jgi:hypothetical protein